MSVFKTFILKKKILQLTEGIIIIKQTEVKIYIKRNRPTS